MVPLNAFSKMAKKRVFSQTAQFRESRKMESKQLNSLTGKRTFCTQMVRE